MIDKSNTEKWVDTKAVAEYLNINRQTAFAWIAQKNLPAVRMGKAWRLSFLRLMLGYALVKLRTN